MSLMFSMGFPGGSDSKELTYSAGDRVRSLGREDPLEKEMGTHSTVLAWKILWTEEPAVGYTETYTDSRLQYMRLQKSWTKPLCD